MAERQKHGFIYEENYIELNSLVKEENYTHSFDAYDKQGIPYQIKTIKFGSSIDMGDIFRNAKKEKDFYLVIGFWEKDKKNIIEEHKLFIEHKKWNSLLNFDKFEELREWISGVSNSHSYDIQWEEEMSFWKKEWGKRKIQIRFKRDHKTQKRIQCAINKKDFYTYFLKEFNCGK